MSPKKTKPGRGRPVGSDREENTEKILSTAMRCFARNGYGQTTFQEIANQVGFTRSAMYPYFSNKAELYHAILNQQQQIHYEELHETLTSPLSFREKLGKVLQVFIADHEEHYDRSAFLASSPMEMARNPELLETYEETASTPGMLVEFFTESIENGEITDAYSPEDLLVLVIGGVMGMSLYQRNVGIGKFDHAVNAFMDMINGNFVK